MRYSRLILSTLTFLFLITASPLFAWDDWLPITPEDQKITSQSANGADAIILYHEETANDNTQHRYVYMRVKVLTEKGKKYADVEIPYDASFAGISDIKGRTVSPDGTITPFAGKAFNSTIVKGHGIKYLAKKFTLPNVQVGSIIEWKFTEYWEDYVLSAHWTVQDTLAQKRAKFVFIPFFKSGQYVEDSRGEIKDRVLYQMVGLPSNTAIKSIGDDRMELELKDIPAFQEEDFAPPADLLKMRVNFYYGTSKTSNPQEFWKQEGKYWSKDVDKFIGRPDSSVLKDIVSASDTPDQKLHKIYAYVQKIKNLNYEGHADDELPNTNNKEKRSVETVLRKQEGFRDEITRTFVGLARAAGVEAYEMRVADRNETFFQVNVPNPSQLTSELAIVMVDGKPVFLDPGTPYCPYGLLPWRHTSTHGLRQLPNGASEVTSTPPADYKNAISKRVGRLQLSADGSVHGQVAVAWTGVEALEHRLSGFHTDEAGRKKELENELQEVLPPGSSVEELKATGWDTPGEQLSATFKVDVPSFASSTGKRLLVPSHLFQGEKTQPFSHGERKQPVYFSYPYYAMDDVQITFPAEFHVENLPQSAPINTAFSVYKVDRSVSGNTLSVARTFAIGGIAFNRDQFPAVKQFFDSVTADDAESLVLTSGQ